MHAVAGTTPRSSKRQRFVWCLYDFGNSAYPTIIMTAVYALYFADVVVPAEQRTSSDKWWGWANGIGALFVVLSAPFLGSLADRIRGKRLLLMLHLVVGVASCAALALAGPGDVRLAMILIVVSLYAFEGGNVFYNAFLPELVEAREVSSLGARGWAFGYAGGLLSLGVVIGAIELGYDARYCAVIAAAWWLAFGVWAVVWLRDDPREAALASSARGPGIGARLQALRTEGNLLRFLIALFFYMNALSTIFVFAAVFTRTSLGFERLESLLLILLLNVVAMPGSLVFGRLARRIGTLRSIEISLVLWILVVVASILTAWPGLFDAATSKAAFWGVASLAALCIGATQATSRSYVGEISPPGMSGEFFGMMAIAGRASAIVGPIVFGELSDLCGGDQRLALGSVGAFFLLGLVLLMRCRPSRASETGAHTA
ncbi:MAG: MFS transporter [Planctomycetes bacterium]|nr:MFS transporter [Planctomycetota bacterium]